MLSQVLNDIYLGNIVIVDPLTYPDNPGCLQKLEISPIGSAGIAALDDSYVSYLPDSTVGVPYSMTLEATGGTPPYTWSIILGALPSDLTLDPTSGEISGLPTTAGTDPLTVQVMDSTGATDSLKVSITINALPAITISSLPNATIGVPYTEVLEMTGGTPPHTWAIASGALPAGLSLDSNTGEISGVPTAHEAQDFTVRLTDGVGAMDTQALSLAIRLAVITASLPEGTWGASYAASLEASGGEPPYSWGMTAGALPAGLALDSNTGEIWGIPTASGEYPLTVEVLDNAGATDSVGLIITINPPLEVTTISLPEGTVGAFYTATLESSGGTLPHAWDANPEALPAGLSLNSTTGEISGTPTTASVHPFIVELLDNAGAMDNMPLSITINSPPAITTGSLPDGTAGAAYNVSVEASGGTTPYASWEVISGTLPASLNLDLNTGEISGTPTAAGLETFTVQVTDGAGATDSAVLSIDINQPPTITTGSLPEGTVNMFYSVSLVIVGGATPYTWTSGALPTGLSLNSITGEIAGIPTAVAEAQVIAVEVMDSVGAMDGVFLSITINPLPSITTISLPEGTAGTFYSASLMAAGGTAPYTWASGALPNGLSLDSITGEIAGTPTAVAEAQVITVEVMDGAGAMDSVPLSITINPPLAITTSILPDQTVNEPYMATLEASGGTLPRTWEVIYGTLPTGLSLDTNTGEITGTPTAVETKNITVEVMDDAGATDSVQMSITINPSPAITTISLPEGTVNGPYSASLVVVGGTTPYIWASGPLPAGLSLDSITGEIAGTPTAVAEAQFITIEVMDSSGAMDSKQLSITINAGPEISTAEIAAGSTAGGDGELPEGTVNIPYGAILQAAEGTPPYLLWSVSLGNLPAGISLNPDTGEISGTAETDGNWDFTIQVEDSVGATGDKDFTITINPWPTIITTELPGGQVDEDYEQFQIIAEGGTGSYTWAIVKGHLPDGLILGPTGIIYGIPSKATRGIGQEKIITVEITDSLGATGVGQMTITIKK